MIFISLLILLGTGFALLISALGSALFIWLASWLILGGRGFMLCLRATLRVYVYVFIFSLFYVALLFTVGLVTPLSLLLLSVAIPLSLWVASSSLATSLRCSLWQALLIVLLAGLLNALIMHPLRHQEVLPAHWPAWHSHSGLMT